MNSRFSRIRPFGYIAILLIAVPNPASAGKIDLERPGQTEFVRDLAGMINPTDKARIVQMCNEVWKTKATPIIIVTIDSMAAHGGADLKIETFARLLFDQWGIGIAKLGDVNWNTGVLLLVSKGDRRVRIELGGGWGHEQDKPCQQILDEFVLPKFKQGDFSGGIVLGVERLTKMVQGLKIPAQPSP
jgi:uncharacterized protein